MLNIQRALGTTVLGQTPASQNKLFFANLINKPQTAANQYNEQCLMIMAKRLSYPRMPYKADIRMNKWVKVSIKLSLKPLCIEGIVTYFFLIGFRVHDMHSAIWDVWRLPSCWFRQNVRCHTRTTSSLISNNV